MDPHRSPLRCHERTDPEEVLEGACVLGSAHVFIPLSVEPGDYSNAFERVRDKKTMSDAPRMIRNSDSPSAHPKPTCGTMVLGDNRGRAVGGTMSSILIVDDHSPQRSLIRAIVRLDGHDVSEAGSGEEALACMATTPYDLMIL